MPAVLEKIRRGAQDLTWEKSSCATIIHEPTLPTWNSTLSKALQWNRYTHPQHNRDLTSCNLFIFLMLVGKWLGRILSINTFEIRIYVFDGKDQNSADRDFKPLKMLSQLTKYTWIQSMIPNGASASGVVLERWVMLLNVRKNTSKRCNSWKKNIFNQWRLPREFCSDPTIQKNKGEFIRDDDRDNFLVGAARQNGKNSEVH